MSQSARLTIVIPAYKAERTIRRAVDSALAQQGVDVRVVVVVDGLLDDTVRELQAYDGELVRVVVQETNRGSQVTRNRGLAEAEGEFVMFLDSDDFIEGPLLASLSQAMQGERADIGFGTLQVMEERTGKRRPPVDRSFDSPRHLFWSWLADAETLPPCATLWRTAFVRSIGGWNEKVRRNQDGELVLRAIMSGAKFVHGREGRGVYVHHDSEDRITARPEVLGSRLDVGEMILARRSDVIPDSLKRSAVARYFYRVSLNCFSRGNPDLALQALGRSRDLGFTGHSGPLWHRLVARLLGVPLRYRITNFVKRHRLLGFKGL